MEISKGYVSDSKCRVYNLPSPYVKLNVLIDRTGHARLTDFGLLTIMSDPSSQLSSNSNIHAGGTPRWMSPELIDSQRFGSANCLPTISSDCYALGMVVYEVIGGREPFHEIGKITALARVLEGGRPPRDADFADILWEMLQRCWVAQASNRPDVEEVLQCLESVWRSSKSPSSVDETTTTDKDEVPTIEYGDVPMTVEYAEDLNLASHSPGKFPHFTYYEAS